MVMLCDILGKYVMAAPSHSQIKAVTLLGSSSGRNAGDAALIGAIMDDIDAALGQRTRFEIPTIRPSYVKNNYQNEVIPVSMLPWSLSLKMLGVPTYRSVMSTDLSLIFDAVLFDRALYNPLFNHMATLAWLFKEARKKGKLLGCYNVGLGPVTSEAGKKLLRYILNTVDFVTVRDKDSLALLKSLEVSNERVLQTADAALTLEPASSDRVKDICGSLKIDLQEQLLGVNINAYLDTWLDHAGHASVGRERFVAIYGEGLNYFLEEVNASLVFVSTQHHDVSVTKELMAKIRPDGKKYLFSNTDWNHSEVKALQGRLQLMCGMRLHSCILATSILTPTVGLVYQKKVRSFFESLDMVDCCVELHSFSSRSLADTLIESWKKKESIRERLSNVIPAQQEKARLAAQVVKELSSTRDAHEAFSRVTSSAYGSSKEALLLSGVAHNA
jgi:polysaccharide pyruvyl transferase WcaK-like protein